MNLPKILLALFFVKNLVSPKWLEFCAYFMKFRSFAKTVNWKFDVFVRASLQMRREEKQLDATGWSIAHTICSPYFGHFYAHHQELATICVLLPPMVCSDMDACGRKQAMRPE